jgi:hypothetical protein
LDNYLIFYEWGELMLLHHQLKKLAEKKETLLEAKTQVEDNKAKTGRKEKPKASGKE